MYNEPNKQKSGAPPPPRFAIGGSRATLDPRNAKLEELLPLAKHKLELPPGWEKVHQYVYVLQPTTDEHGWQYRSEWSNGTIGDNEEQWQKSNSPGLDVRRRLWMTTVVKRDEVAEAKRKLSEAFQTRPKSVVMEGELFRQEQGALMKNWHKRYVVLYDNCMEVYSGGSKEAGGKKITEFSIVDCDAKMLFGVQCPGREFAFSVRTGEGKLLGLFDAENREVRRRWVVAIRYQLALLSQEMNFPPFDYGPPTGDEAATRILMCGELQKQGHMVRNWKQRFFQLNPYELQYFDREVMKGSFSITGATLLSEEKSLDFTLRAPNGKSLVMRADTLNNKATWIRALTRQIAVQNERAENAAKEGTDTASAGESAAGDVKEAAATSSSEPRDGDDAIVERIVDRSVQEGEAAEKEDERLEWNQENSPKGASIDGNDASVIAVVGADDDEAVSHEETQIPTQEETQQNEEVRSASEDVKALGSAVAAMHVAEHEDSSHQHSKRAPSPPLTHHDEVRPPAPPSQMEDVSSTNASEHHEHLVDHHHGTEEHQEHHHNVSEGDHDHEHHHHGTEEHHHCAEEHHHKVSENDHDHEHHHHDTEERHHHGSEEHHHCAEEHHHKVSESDHDHEHHHHGTEECHHHDTEEHHHHHGTEEHQEPHHKVSEGDPHHEHHHHGTEEHDHHGTEEHHHDISEGDHQTSGHEDSSTPSKSTKWGTVRKVVTHKTVAIAEEAPISPNASSPRISTLQQKATKRQSVVADQILKWELLKEQKLAEEKARELEKGRK